MAQFRNPVIDFLYNEGPSAPSLPSHVIINFPDNTGNLYVCRQWVPISPQKSICHQFVQVSRSRFTEDIYCMTFERQQRSNNWIDPSPVVHNNWIFSYRSRSLTDCTYTLWICGVDDETDEQ